MTIDEALQFLQRHQPMPPTRELSDELCQQFDDVRKFLLAHPDERCVDLLLNSFGEGDAHGVYQLVEDVLGAFPDELIVQALSRSLRNSSGGVRYWSAQIAGSYRSPELAAPLIDMLTRGCADERLAAADALHLLGSQQARSALEAALQNESDGEVKAWIQRLVHE